MMQFIATNLCLWLGAVFYETIEEIEKLTHEEQTNTTISTTTNMCKYIKTIRLRSPFIVYKVRVDIPSDYDDHKTSTVFGLKDG